MLKFSATLFTFFISVPCFGQVDFKDLEWYEIKHQSKVKDKPILVDVYTDWCRPCKKMDTLTFGDPKVSAYLNEHFINAKWNAEKKDMRKLASSYAVRAYPTVLFLAADGNEYKRLVGYQDVNQMLTQAQSLVKFLNTNFDSTAQVLLSAEKRDSSEMLNFLQENKGLKIEAKTNVFNAYFDIVKNRVLSLEEFEVLVDNMNNSEQVAFAIKNIPTKNLKDIKIRTVKVNSQSIIKAHIKSKIKAHLNDRDMMVFNEYLDLNYKFQKKINAITQGENAKKENQTYLLDYFSKHRKYEDYDSLATLLINKYILPFKPEMVRTTDARTQEIIKKMEKNNQRSEELNLRAQVTRSSSKAFKLATRLNELAGNYSKFYFEKEKFEKALAWTELAIEYIDIPEARLTKARLLNKLNRNEEAKNEIEIGLQSSLLDWRIKSDLIGLQTIMNRP